MGQETSITVLLQTTFIVGIVGIITLKRIRMRKQTISKETASMVIEFFRLHPQKDYCVADSVEQKEMVFWRKDIPWLEKLP